MNEDNSKNYPDTFPEARKLTWGEMKEAKKAGADPTAEVNIGRSMLTVTGKFTDFVVDVIYPDFDFTPFTYLDVTKFALAVFRKTVGTEQEEKNS